MRDLSGICSGAQQVTHHSVFHLSLTIMEIPRLLTYALTYLPTYLPTYLLTYWRTYWLTYLHLLTYTYLQTIMEINRGWVGNGTMD